MSPSSILSVAADGPHTDGRHVNAPTFSKARAATRGLESDPTQPVASFDTTRGDCVASEQVPPRAWRMTPTRTHLVAVANAQRY